LSVNPKDVIQMAAPAENGAESLVKFGQLHLIRHRKPGGSPWGLRYGELLLKSRV
jgi:hypothetical protein